MMAARGGFEVEYMMVGVRKNRRGVSARAPVSEAEEAGS